jgi:hypothetical protein
MIAMPTVVLCLFRLFRLLCSGHESVVIENAALRLQLCAYHRKRKRPVLTNSDRLFWCALAKVWSGWRDTLLFVQPEMWCDGSANGFDGSGRGFPSQKVAEEGRVFRSKCGSSFRSWPWRIPFGALRGSMVNSRCWVLKSRSGRFRGSYALFLEGHHRVGRHS